jgi:phosphoribosylformimino-5-aminoimidazole carboxamide ribotide isomerase
MDIIPAIDLIDGKCVRLSQGDYDRKTIYNSNPLEVAKLFEDNGIKRLHLVDLDGAKANHIVNYRVLEKIAVNTSLLIDFGGGLKSDNDLRIAFECGAGMITGGSIAVKSPEIFESWLVKYGSDKIILGADVRNEMISVTGWTESTDLKLLPFLGEYINKGITKVICTDIGKDGMLEGPSTELYKKILSEYPELYLVASGGVSSLKDLENLLLAGVPAVIFGKAIYEGRIDLKDLKNFL